MLLSRPEQEKGVNEIFWESVDEKLVFVGLSGTKEEIFEKLGGELINLGFCKESYVQGLKEREKVFPTGILIGDIGVAIPHTDSEHVIKSAIAIGILQHPVMFCQMATNPDERIYVPVQIVIMLAIGGAGHLDMLQKAVLMIQDKKVLEALSLAKNSKEVIGIIKEKEGEIRENH